MANWIDTKKSAWLLAPAGGRRGLHEIALTLVDTLLVWQERAHQRHLLAQLDDRMLKDIGVGWADAQLEARKPCWRA